MSGSNKTIIVTGGTKGLGLEVVKKFSKNAKFNIIALGRNNCHLKKLNTNNVYFYKCDISKTSEIVKTFEKIKKKFKLVDYLINNASIFENKPLDKLTLKKIHEVIDTNFKGYVTSTYLFLSVANKNFSRIINIGSVSGEYGIKNQAVYSATKHAVNGFFDAFAQEDFCENIQITTINPGGIDTSLWNSSNPYPGKLKRELLKPEDIINMIEFIFNQKPNVVIKKIICFPKNEWH